MRSLFIFINILVTVLAVSLQAEVTTRTIKPVPLPAYTIESLNKTQIKGNLNDIDKWPKLTTLWSKLAEADILIKFKKAVKLPNIGIAKLGWNWAVPKLVGISVNGGKEISYKLKAPRLTPLSKKIEVSIISLPPQPIKSLRIRVISIQTPYCKFGTLKVILPKFVPTKFKVNPLFTDNMVLQRKIQVPVWGTGVPNATLAIQINGQKYTVTVDENGKWLTRIKALPVGGPYTMKIIGDGESLTINNILSGDVWICSGQSNMQWDVARSQNPDKEIAAAKYPNIRLFQVKRAVSATPLSAVVGKWKKCTPATVKHFSAVGYFFGRDLHRSLNVPIGLINTSFGGTPAEAWTSQDYLKTDPILKPIMDRHYRKLEGYPEKLKNYKKQLVEWKKKRVASRPRYPYCPNHHRYVGGLYNAMIYPLIPYGIKGAIWYQGEDNVGRGWQYRTLLPAMINCWRKAWNQGDFPFLIVQLANYGWILQYPSNSNWAELREAQSLTAAKLPACGLVSIIDIGDSKKIHPSNKQGVGKRLELAALKIAYGKDIVFSGPTYLSHQIEGDKIIVKFSNVGGGLIAKDGILKRFAIAGKDKKFVWAKAVIKGSTVIVSNSKTKNPVALRYAWSTNPAGCNLYNKEGLPAVPFRTDSWTGVTDSKR